MRISWVDKVTNEEVFRIIGEKRIVWKNVVKRRDGLDTYYDTKEA